MPDGAAYRTSSLRTWAKAALTLAVLLTTTPNAFSQEIKKAPILVGADGLAPEQVMTFAIAALAEHRWDDFAGWHDHHALVQFKLFVIECSELPDDAPPGLGFLDTFFPNLANKEEINQLSEIEVFGAFMQGFMTQTGMLDAAATIRSEQIGPVRENDTVIHFVHRVHMQIGGVDIALVEAIPMHDTPKGWRLGLKADVLSLVEASRRHMEARAAEPPVLEDAADNPNEDIDG